ncbi:MAG: HEAT repeat domain-containing protein [Myxococcota bacterium]
MTHPVVAGLRAPEPEARRDACRAAVADPAAVLLLDPLVEALGDPDRTVSRAASDAIARIGGRQPETLRALRGALHGDSPAKRWGAAFTLARVTPPEPGWLPAVVEAMGSPDGDVRWAATRLLVDIARLDPGTGPVVLGLARGADQPAVRRMATFALRDLAPDDPATTAALLDNSRSPDAGLRRAAFTALAALCEPTRAVWDRLAESLASERDPGVRALAAHGAGELAARTREGLPRSVRALLEGLSSQSPSGVRRAAAAALQRARDPHPAPGAGAPESDQSHGEERR